MANKSCRNKKYLCFFADRTEAWLNARCVYNHFKEILFFKKKKTNKNKICEKKIWYII